MQMYHLPENQPLAVWQVDHREALMVLAWNKKLQHLPITFIYPSQITVCTYCIGLFCHVHVLAVRFFFCCCYMNHTQTCMACWSGHISRSRIPPQAQEVEYGIKILLLEIIPGTVAGEWHGLSLQIQCIYLLFIFLKKETRALRKLHCQVSWWASKHISILWLVTNYVSTGNIYYIYWHGDTLQYKKDFLWLKWKTKVHQTLLYKCRLLTLF